LRTGYGGEDEAKRPSPRLFSQLYPARTWSYAEEVWTGVGFDRFAEKECAPYYASLRGRSSLPPGRYFRMHLVGYFEGIDRERGLEWRCSDSLSLREVLRLGTPVAIRP
jgi:hypothetical protein